MDHCKDCKHFDRNPDSEYSNPDWGGCALADSNLDLGASLAHVTGYGQESLIVNIAFGCIQFEPKGFMEGEKKVQPMPEQAALALAIAGLYGEALRAQERGDVASASRCLDAYERLGALNAERGAPSITQSLCATMLSEHERRMRERQ